jgi:hypothetical protein
MFEQGGPVLSHESYTVTLGRHILLPYWSFRMNGKRLKFLFKGPKWPEALTRLLEEIKKRQVMSGRIEGDLLIGTFPIGSEVFDRCEIDLKARTIKVFECKRNT